MTGRMLVGGPVLVLGLVVVAAWLASLWLRPAPAATGDSDGPVVVERPERRPPSDADTADGQRLAADAATTDGRRSSQVGASSGTGDAAGDEREPLAADAEAAVGPALLAYFRAEFERGWRSVRADAPPDAVVARAEDEFREVVLALPAHLGARAAGDRDDAERARSAATEGDGTALIALAEKGVYRPAADDLEWKALDAAFEGPPSGAAVDGASYAAAREPGLADGATLHFGPGVHALDERLLRGADGSTLPADVTVVGAGRDVTLLRIGNISVRGDAERLAFRDLTLDAENDGLFDMRSGSLVVDLERVRVVRFDAGHGGCTIFSTDGALIRATDSLFVGGYGKSPGHGRLTDARPTLARFTGCRFELLELGLGGLGPTDRVVFRECVFDLLDEDPRERSSSSTAFVGCRFERPLEGASSREALRKDLADLFWELRGR